MLTAHKLDLFKAHRAEYVARRSPTLVRVGPATYLGIEGSGAPGGETYRTRLAALHDVAFTIRMGSKEIGRGYGISKLEALWWPVDGGHDVMHTPRERLRWRLLIRTPDFIGNDEVYSAIEHLRGRGRAGEVEHVTHETMHEGACVQLLHVGPYDAEPESVARMRAFAAAHAVEPHGAHHEIYLSDPRRVPAERLRTILRQPVR